MPLPWSHCHLVSLSMKLEIIVYLYIKYQKRSVYIKKNGVGASSFIQHISSSYLKKLLRWSVEQSMDSLFTPSVHCRIKNHMKAVGGLLPLKLNSRNIAHLDTSYPSPKKPKHHPVT